MAQLVQSFVGDTAIRLQNEEYVRQMSFGPDWSLLRIGVRLALPQGTGNFGTGPSLYIGLCQGTTNGFKSVATDEWMGWRIGNGNWNYNAGPPAYFNATGGHNRCYKIGSTLTVGSLVSVTNYVTVNQHSYWMADFYRIPGGTGYSLGADGPALPTAATPDITEPNFLMSAAADQTSYSALNYATNSLLDSVSIYWNYGSVGLEISSILVVRFV